MSNQSANIDQNLEDKVREFVIDNFTAIQQTTKLQTYSDLVRAKHIAGFVRRGKLFKKARLDPLKKVEIQANSDRKRVLVNRKKSISRKSVVSMRKYLRNFKYSPKPKFTIDESTARKMNQMWSDYVSKVLDGPGAKEASALLKIDFHGAPVTITASNQHNLVGKQGLIVLDTQNTFTLLKDGALETVTKKGSDWTVSLPKNKVVTYRGDALCYNPIIRSSKKFKRASFW